MTEGVDSKRNGERLVISGGRRLTGGVKLHGAKNAVLPLLAAGVLTDEEVIIEDCPYITDVDCMIELIRGLGKTIERSGREIRMKGGITSLNAGEALCKSMRSSVFMLGALLSVTGEAKLFSPGGCKIGDRPLDIHFDGLRRMGAECAIRDGLIYCRAEKLYGGDIVLRFPSVGATENLLISAVLADGETNLINCAREPEIVSLAEGLRKMGADISGEGTSVMRIKGVKKLHGARLTPNFDRIVAGTLIAATSLTGGDVFLYGAKLSDIRSTVSAFISEHCSVTEDNAGIRIVSDGKVEAGSVITSPYPLFPTDMQPQFTACKCFAKGVSKVTENVFENRFGYINELMKMGADIRADGSAVTVFGKDRLHSAKMYASDLRGGAALAVAALKADGESEIYNLYYLDRGYESIETVFGNLNADFKREIRI